MSETDQQYLEGRTFYLSGPMSGYEGYNYSEFEKVAKYLRDQGLTVISPHEIPAPPDDVTGEQAVWEWYMEQCFQQIALCTDIVLIKGWPESRGANRELEECVRRMFPVWYFSWDNGDGNDLLIKMSRRERYGEPVGTEEAEASDSA